MDKVSVVLPVYNGEDYLFRCLESLTKQSYKNVEFICVNDGSNDKSLEILKSFKDDRIIVIDKKNTGVSDSRNIAIEAASGDYVCFCDADDIYQPYYIETMLKYIKTYNADVVRCNYTVIDKNEQVINRGVIDDGFYSKTEIENKIIPLCLKGDIPCFTYLLMIKSDVLKSRFPTDIAMMEDVIFYIDLLMNINSLYITDESLYTIMFNQNGATNNVFNYTRNINNVILVNDYIKKILVSNNIDSIENIENININNLKAIADFAFKNYVYGTNTLVLCKNTVIDSLMENTDLNKIDIVRRVLLKLWFKRSYLLLNLYFLLRKIVFKIKNFRK